MNITFLIGNGFDVSMGIKSSYGEFYKWYCPQESEKEHINKFRKEIDKDVKSASPREQKAWADLEVGLGRYTNEFSPDNVDKYLECIEDVKANIIKYLKEQDEKFITKYIKPNSLSKFIESMGNWYDEVMELGKNQVQKAVNSRRNENSSISFITFNYTYTLEKILSVIDNDVVSTWEYFGSRRSCKLNRDVIHAHGTIDMLPVMGVNDDSQIDNKALLATPRFREYLVKEECIKKIGLGWHERAESKIRESQVVCVFGMSIGPTDAKWWISLSEWLKADPSRQLVVYWYNEKKDHTLSTLRYIRLVEDTKELLLSYNGALTPKENEELSSRIHIVVNTNKFLKLDMMSQNEIDRYDALEEARQAALEMKAAERAKEIVEAIV